MKKFRFILDEDGNYVDIEAKSRSEATSTAKKQTGIRIFYGVEEIETTVDPERDAYRKYLRWWHSIHQETEGLFHEEGFWGEESTRYAIAFDDCPLSKEEIRLARNYALFIGDRTALKGWT